MKTIASLCLLSIFALSTIISNTVSAADYKKKGDKKVKIIPCFTIADDTARKLCNRERDLRIARRALNILSVGPGGTSHGGAADCAATAEADCNGVLEDVDSLSYKDGICIWSCKAFTTPSSGDN